MCDDACCSLLFGCFRCCESAVDEQRRKRNMLKEQKEKEERELAQLMGPTDEFQADPSTFQMSRVRF